MPLCLHSDPPWQAHPSPGPEPLDPSPLLTPRQVSGHAHPPRAPLRLPDLSKGQCSVLSGEEGGGGGGEVAEKWSLEKSQANHTASRQHSTKTAHREAAAVLPALPRSEGLLPTQVPRLDRVGVSGAKECAGV